MMETRVRHPVSHSRCYASLDYGYDGGRYSLPTPARQPLQESTGNVQQHGSLSASRAPYAQHIDAFSVVRPSIHTPPILPTQSFTPSYPTRSSSASSSSSSTYHRLQQPHPFAHFPPQRSSINPLCLSRQFQQYRTKQAQKEDKSDQTWPDVLEDAFLDALLLIPHMGRKKYGMNQKQCGRNMLITDYLWIAYRESLPPGMVPDPKMKRHRKQVSSHIQVLKGFFRHHPMYHIFFSKEEKRDDKTKDTVETGSLKDHPVLRALAEERLPDERPNYDYFAQLLAFESQITVKPKRCWIFVAHSDVVVRTNGTGYNPTTGEELSGADYPHLKENLVKDTWPREDKTMLPGALLHRFTKTLEQVESSSVREISSQWAADFPELATHLDAATVSGDETGGQQAPSCDILHMHLTLEMQRRRHFPAQSELNSWVEINVEQPHLLHHRWKVVTRLARPTELCRGGGGGGSGGGVDGSALYETSAEMGVQYVHQPRCEGPLSGQPCDCIGQSQRQVVSVPFPADVWARTLTNCAEYPAHPLVLDQHGDGGKGGGRKVELSEREEHSVKSKIKKHLTQMELVPKVAMFQEVWSCPPAARDGDAYDASTGEPRKRTSSSGWKRRAVILWTFETVHSISYTMRGKNELITSPEGKGQWRFLTTLDPTSQYHQKRSLLSANTLPPSAASDPNLAVVPSGSVAGGPHPRLSRDDVMSPTPNYHQQLNASMNENFSLAWDASAGVSIPAYPGTVFAHAPAGSHHPGLYAHPATSGPALNGGLDSFSTSNGLATPPPTASLAGSFAHGYGSGHGHHTHTTHSTHATHANGSGHVDVSNHHQNLDLMAAAVTSAGMGRSTTSSLAADQYLGAAGGDGYAVGVYGAADVGDGSLQGWDVGGLSGMDDARLVHGQWAPAGYPAQTTTTSTAGVLDWSAPAPAPVHSPRDGAVGLESGSPPGALVQHQHQHQHQHHPVEGAVTNHDVAGVGCRKGSWGAGSSGPSENDGSSGLPQGCMLPPEAGHSNSNNNHNNIDAQPQLHPPPTLYSDRRERLFPLGRTKSLKRGREESDVDRENDPRAPSLKVARYATTSASDLN